MKIILISFSTRSAIGDYLYLLVKELVKYKEVFLIVPDYFDKKIEVYNLFESYKSIRNFAINNRNKKN
jgi:hypothetical protein